MAAPYPSPRSREAAPDSNDDKYKIADEVRYKSIAQNNYDKHLELGQSIPREQCRILASRLLQSTEISAVLNKERVQYLGLEVLNIWMEKPRSTIWVLKGHLKEMGLCDSLAILENARLDYVSLYIVIYEMVNSMQGPPMKHKKTVPGEKPLVDVIRPIVNRNQGLKMTKREKILNLRLVRSIDGDHDITWNSPARNFKGEQVDIHMYYTNASERRHTDPGRKLEGVTRVERNVISWIDEGSLCFGYVESEPVAAGEDAEQLVHPVQEMGQDLAKSMDELSLKSDSSLEGHLFGQTRERRTRMPTEVDDSSNSPGFPISIGPTTEETSMEERPSQHSQ